MSTLASEALKAQIEDVLLQPELGLTRSVEVTS
jgi:hypothetical protein